MVGKTTCDISQVRMARHSHWLMASVSPHEAKVF